MLDGSGVKAMPGSIPAPNPGSINNWKERKFKQPNGANQKKEKKLKKLGFAQWFDLIFATSPAALKITLALKMAKMTQK